MKKHTNARKVGDEVNISNEQKGIITRISNGKARVEMGDTMRIVPLSDLEKEEKPNSQWSEEDEEMLNSTIATCKLVQEERDSSPARHLFKKQERWLKTHYSNEKSEKPIEGLEEEIKRYGEKNMFTIPAFQQVARHFAKWQKEQMMKEAVEGQIYGEIRHQEDEPYEIYAESDSLPLNGKFNIGDKVRIIIVKED